MNARVRGKAPARPPLPAWGRRRWFTLVLPLAISLLAWGVVWASTSGRVALEVLSAAALCFVGFGSTVVFVPAVDPRVALSAWEVAIVMAYTSTWAALLYAYNLDLLERVPRLGPFLRRARLTAVAGLREHPWIRRLATLGVGLFVMLPMPGSGSLGGSLVGRIAGLSALGTFLAVALAGLAVTLVYTAFADRLAAVFEQQAVGLPLRIAGAVLTLLLVWFLFRLLQRMASRGAAGGPP